MTLAALPDSQFPSNESLRLVPDLHSLVEHRIWVSAQTRVDVVYESFREHEYEFIGVVQDGQMVGAVSRAQIALLLSGRFGFAIYARRAISEHLLGGTVTVEVGMSLLEVLHRALSREGESFHRDVALVDKDGAYQGMIPTQRLVRVQSALVHQQVAALEQQRNALEERNRALFRSSHQLRQSEGRFGILFENSALGVALLSPQGDLELANQRLMALLGPEVHELNFFPLLAPEDRGRFAEMLVSHDRHSDPEARTTLEFKLTLPSRGQRLFKFFTHWIAETGQVCALIDDITEQRALEQRMAQGEKSALLESLVGGIAHELNNKLSPVLGYAELLLMSCEPRTELKEFRSSCEIISQSACEASEIVRQLLQLSRPTALELSACDLRAVVEDALPILRFRLRQGACTVQLDMPHEAVMVKSDAAQIKQLIVNMALNAIDAMSSRPTGTLTLRVQVVNGCGILWINDTGCGIAAEHRSRIFDPFFTTKSPQQGTGLGLSVCFSIIKQHKGEITLERTSSAGTSFRISLPLAAAEPVETLLDFADEEEEEESYAALALREDRLRVLVVDDEEFITRLVQEALWRQFKARVVQVQTGEQAVERLQQESFDLVISDVRMPGLDGFGLFSWIRDHQPETIARFMFITGDAGSADLNMELGQLGVPVLRKPFRTKELIAECETLLAKVGPIPRKKAAALA